MDYGQRTTDASLTKKTCCDPPQRWLQSHRSIYHPSAISAEGFTMRKACLFLFVIGLLPWYSPAADRDEKQPVRKKFGLEKRVPWTTSKVIGSPEPPPPYTTEPAFPALPKFEEPLDLVSA